MNPKSRRRTPPRRQSVSAASQSVGDAIPLTPPRKRAAAKFVLINDFRTYSLRHLSPTAATVWFLLWTYADATGVARMMSLTRIAAEIGKSRDTAKKAVSELTPRHLVRIGGGARPGDVSVYRLRSGTESWKGGKSTAPIKT